MLSPNQVQAYLRRIGFSGEPKPALSTLAALQTAHLKAVPYETIDLFEHREVSLSPDALYEKIVLRGRGGYCFELNELYTELLEALGFSVTRRFSRILKGATGIPEPRHLLPVVRFGEAEYLSDVGVTFYSPMEPVLLSETPQKQSRGTWSVQKDELYGHVMVEHENGQCFPILSVAAETSYPIDFEAIHFYCCHHPASFFANRLFLGIRTEDGSITYRDGILSVFKDKTPLSKNEISYEDLKKDLPKYFSILL